MEMHVDLSAYVGKWVAIAVGEQIAGVGNTAQEATQVARRNRPKDRFVLRFVAPILTEKMGIAELWAGLRPLFTQQNQPIYLVGGAVRDLLLGHAGHDLDFVVQKQAIKLSFAIADQLGVPAYPLDRKRDTGRVMLADNRTTLDFARFRGNSLEDDLRERDFTINAMALPATATLEPAATAVSPSAIIDPCNGFTDLQAKRIHPTHKNALQQDPVRALRAIRLGLSLDFTLSAETETAVTQAAPHLHQISNERVRDELLKLLSTSQPDEAIMQLHRLGVLTAVLPDIAQLIA
ncbi:MAG: CCA tRNA nucleotidyltransferase, partial [Chloroflexi bacterium]|nr:CCA tRNA nucleotidyltransferase [Chloroflexota bacterium]